MNLRCLVALVVLLGTLACVPFVSAANRTGMSRQDIKAMPINDRPNRPGHVYGNSVRRVNVGNANAWPMSDMANVHFTGR